MVEHALEPARLREVAGHVDSCLHCREATAALSGGPTALGTLPIEPQERHESIAGLTINNRYEVRIVLGRGGMGTVYLARDRTLDRDVALKLHRAGSGGDRLHREAIAMAKLAHPNVVTVFEIAAYHDRLYVAMEYVGAGTLRSWLADRPRGWRDIVELLLQAGTGLAAAHTAGLVHRDFKPENVLVGDDGRARVSDFGLARSALYPIDSIATPTHSLVDVSMTQSGAVVGTPAYMAYEQLAGGTVDARSDQFAFCVVAWECLFGKRPFEGSTMATLAVAIDRHEVLEPKSTQVPPRVRDVLRRGLAVAPDDRHADMSALLASLRAAAAPSSRRRIALTLGGALFGTTAIAVGVASAWPARTEAASCAVPADSFTEVWDPALQTRIRDAFAKQRPADGAAIYARASTHLDGYRDTWVTMRRDACEATRTRGEQSETLLDLRMSCLDRKRDELRALTHGLAEPDDKVVIGAVRATLGLSSIAGCADTASLTAPVRPPEIHLRAAVEAARRELATARAHRLLGRIDAAREQAEIVVARAAALEYRPLEAKALLVLGDLKDRSGDSAAAIKILERAVIAADASNHRLVAAEGWSNLAWILGYGEHEFERAQLAVQMASARIESLGGHPELSAQLANYEGLILETKGQLAPARDRYLASLAMFDRMGERDGWRASMILNDLGAIERKLGSFTVARQHQERSLAIRIRVFGEHHPYVFSSFVNLGNIAWSQQDFPEAERLFKRAMSVAEHVFPPKHPQRALALTNLGSTYERQGKFEDAIATYRLALAIREATRGPDHPDVADTLRNLGIALHAVGKIDEARRAYERAIEILDGKQDDPALAQVLADHGELLLGRRQLAAAEKQLQRSLAITTGANPEDPDQAYALTLLAQLRHATGKSAQARTLLERALKLRQSEAVPGDELARTELALATVLWTAKPDRPRAIELARAAKLHVEEAKATPHEIHRQVVSWLATHPAP
ncbi:MAG: serine/threonine-protein kinase [Kofleriaceae bacterium]